MANTFVRQLALYIAISNVRSSHSADGLEVAMGIAAANDAQPVQHRPEIQEMGTEITVEGPVKI